MADTAASGDEDAIPEEDAAPPFAPAKPTDGRALGNWETRYPHPLARRWIKIEASYLVAVFIVSCVSILLVEVDLPLTMGLISDSHWETIAPFVLAFFGGALGGTLFATKWLYHSVAKDIWNIDRRLWRFFTPMLASGAALTVTILSAGGVIPLFGSELVTTRAGALGVALLVGYFSDRAFSMLERMASQQFGLPKGQKPDRHE